jgi:serine/threonine-protein kinase PknG
MKCRLEHCEGTLKDGICQLCGLGPEGKQSLYPYGGVADKAVVDKPATVNATSGAVAVAGDGDDLSSTAKRLAVTASMKLILDGETPACKADLLTAAAKFESMVPDDFVSWRLQADLLFTAIRQLETRQMEPDETVTLIGIPLTEHNLRHACEKALRNCAHFAPAYEDRVALIDEANRVRQRTWF